MKMIVAIIRDIDNEPVTQSLVQAGYRVTRIASTGGFLRRGYSTLMIADRGVIVWSCASFTGPAKKYIRVSIGFDRENEQFLAAINSIR